MLIRKVVLADDDHDIRAIAETSLTQVGGWEVTIASSGQEALQKIRQVHPDLILLDVMMPEMDGLATFRKVREIEGFENTPIIFITSKVQTHELESYFSLGVTGCISKPFDPMTLPAEITEIVADAYASVEG